MKGKERVVQITSEERQQIARIAKLRAEGKAPNFSVMHNPKGTSGTAIEVLCCVYTVATANLTVYGSDPDQMYLVFQVYRGENEHSEITMVGWMQAREAKNPKWYVPENKYFSVPQAALHG